MTIKEKIQKYLEYKGVTPTSVERKLEWGVGAFTKPKSITVDRAKEFLLLYSDLSAEWLFRDKGEMLLHSDSSTSDLIEELKAEINMLKGENNVLREQLGLNRRGANVKSA